VVDGIAYEEAGERRSAGDSESFVPRPKAMGNGVASERLRKPAGMEYAADGENPMPKKQISGGKGGENNCNIGEKQIQKGGWMAIETLIHQRSPFFLNGGEGKNTKKKKT